MAAKKNPAACDGWALAKANFENLHKEYSALAFQSQLAFLQRRFGLPPLRAAVVAPLAFGEARP
jgi:hypothetical protein